MSKSKDHRISQYPPHLRGLATNRYGGNQLQRERGFKGGKHGPAGPVHIFTEDERKEYERERGYRDVSPRQSSSFLETVLHLRTEAQELGRIVSWIQTDGPTSESDLADIRTVLEKSGRAGSYGAGTFYLDKRKTPEHHRTRVSGPYEDLVLRKLGVDIFRYVLNTIEIDSAYRVADSGRPMRPSLLPPDKQ